MSGIGCEVSGKATVCGDGYESLPLLWKEFSWMGMKSTTFLGLLGILVFKICLS